MRRTLQLERSRLTSLTRASIGLFQLGETFHAAKAQRCNPRKPAQKSPVVKVVERCRHYRLLRSKPRSRTTLDLEERLDPNARLARRFSQSLAATVPFCDRRRRRARLSKPVS